MKQSNRIKAVHNAPRPQPVRPAVLHLMPDLDLHAEAREVVDLAIQSNRGGWKQLIASAGGALVMEAERAAVRHTLMPLNRTNLFVKWRNRVHLETLFRREHPALIHAHGFEMMIPAHGLELLHRVPLLIDLTEPAIVTPAMKKLLHQVAARGARFRVPSAFMMRHLQNDWALKSDYLYHIPPGVDLNWFDAVRVSPERLHNLNRLWRLPENATILVTAMPMGPDYGHKELLNALASLQRDDIFVVMVGDDASAPGTRDAIVQHVTECKLEGKVIMPETCADWPAACWLASIVVAPNSTPRGQAKELLAAQAIGRPVIVTDCGANAEMVHGGETAWVVKPNDKIALASALSEAIHMSTAQRIDLALRTRNFVTQMFPQSIWCESMFELYRAILEQPMELMAPKVA